MQGTSFTSAGAAVTGWKHNHTVHGRKRPRIPEQSGPDKRNEIALPVLGRRATAGVRKSFPEYKEKPRQRLLRVQDKGLARGAEKIKIGSESCSESVCEYS